jgi:hypothetical protein
MEDLLNWRIRGGAAKYDGTPSVAIGAGFKSACAAS